MVGTPHILLCLSPTAMPLPHVPQSVIPPTPLKSYPNTWWFILLQTCRNGMPIKYQPHILHLLWVREAPEQAKKTTTNRLWLEQRNVNTCMSTRKLVLESQSSYTYLAFIWAALPTKKKHTIRGRKNNSFDFFKIEKALFLSNAFTMS